jgi:hypothetical protein
VPVQVARQLIKQLAQRLRGIGRQDVSRHWQQRLGLRSSLPHR